MNSAGTEGWAAQAPRPAKRCGQHDKRRADDTAGGVRRFAFEQRDAFDQRMLGLRPVAAQRQRGHHHMRFQQRIGIVAARNRSGHGCGIAGQFLVDAQAGNAQMHQRIEPAEAAQQRRQRIDAGILPREMHLLMCQDRGLFRDGEVLLERRPASQCAAATSPTPPARPRPIARRHENAPATGPGAGPSTLRPRPKPQKAASRYRPFRDLMPAFRRHHGMRKRALSHQPARRCARRDRAICRNADIGAAA